MRNEPKPLRCRRAGNDLRVQLRADIGYDAGRGILHSGTCGVGVPPTVESPSSWTDPMGTNVEIKARATDVTRQRELAARISDAPRVLIPQVDTFFEVAVGRLKLREFSADRGELILYDRGPGPGPKTSVYTIAPTSKPAALREILAATLDVRGVVRKQRHLYMVERTRIHFDDVADLGWFIELEVVLSPGESPEDGRTVAVDLMRKLEIRDEDLIDSPYIDLLTDGVGRNLGSPAQP